MKLLLNLAILAAIACLGKAKFTYKDCGSNAGTLVSVEIPNCDDTPCSVKKGSNYSIKVTFNSKEKSDYAWPLVYGIVDGETVPFYGLPNPDGCKNSGLTCPLLSQKTYTYVSTLTVDKVFPDLKVVVKWELADSKENPTNVFFCFETLIQVIG